MNTLDLLTRKLSHKLIVSEALIDKLITFQWKETRAALEDETITSVEITNLGSFLIRERKLKRDIHKFEVTLVNLNNDLSSYTEEEDIVKVNKKIKCGNCLGEGRKWYRGALCPWMFSNSDRWYECNKCDGKGYIKIIEK